MDSMCILIMLCDTTYVSGLRRMRMYCATYDFIHNQMSQNLASSLPRSRVRQGIKWKT